MIKYTIKHHRFFMKNDDVQFAFVFWNKQVVIANEIQSLFYFQQLLSTLMSCRTLVDDIQQLNRTIENEYDIHSINRTQELTQRF